MVAAYPLGTRKMYRRNRASDRQNRKHSTARRRLKLELLEDRRLLATFAVNSLSDATDGNPSDGICDTGSNRAETDPPFIKTGICTFSAAATQADDTPGHDTITFGDLGGTESPEIPLGRGIGLLHAVTIDGTTHASDRVVFVGSLSVTDGSTLKGLSIIGHSTSLSIFGTGNTVTDTYVGYDASGEGRATDDSGNVTIRGNDNVFGTTVASERNLVSGQLNVSGSQNLIIGNYVGVDITGDVPSPNSGVAFVGGEANTLGGSSEGERNVFVGGMVVDGTQIVIQGNYIGTNADGTLALKPDAGNLGVSARANASDLMIGGAEPGEGNLISGLHFGIISAVGAEKIKIWGNKIGTNAAGDGIIGNFEAGVQIGTQFVPSTPSQVQIGGNTTAHGNIISGNGKGIALANIDPSDLLIANNRIGTSANGSSALPNKFGVTVENAKNVVIGGEDGNVISGNETGVLLTGLETTKVHVLNNLIGTESSGDGALGNTTGVSIIHGAHGNIIGGPLPSAPSGPVLGNVISGSVANLAESKWGVGVWIIDSDDNTVQGNRIGTNGTGTAALGNEGEGILVYRSSGTQIGGSKAGEGNLISGNSDGVLLWSDDASRPVSGTVLQGNLIGTNFNGTTAIPNRARGIQLTGTATENQIGGNTPQAQNTISGNMMDGVILFGDETTNNTLHGNYIGTNHAGDAALPNGGSGVHVEDAGGNFIGRRDGGTFARNVISGNTADGITIVGILAIANTIQANLIGLDATGTTAIPNGLNGVVLEDASETTIGGEKTNDRNVISGNMENGIFIGGITANDNEVHQNYIGLNLEGNKAVGNSLSGIVLEDAAENSIGKVEGTSPLRNYIGGNGEHGILVTGPVAELNLIQANYIGIGADGTTKVGNTLSGVSIVDAPNNRVGTYQSAALGGNVISSNSRSGILLQGQGSTGNHIFGNAIGTNGTGVYVAGTSFGNAENGVHILNAKDNFIGGTKRNANFSAGRPTQAIPNTLSLPDTLPPNLIVSNILDGIRVEGATATGNRILDNTIHRNVGQGIDLGSRGYLENDKDALDADTGANGLQNHPEIVNMFAETAAKKFVVEAEFTGAANKQYLIQTFRNKKRSLYGQGEVLVDTQLITTRADGTALITATVDQVPVKDGVPQTAHYSLTATDAAGNTSEFSPSSSLPELYVKDFSIELSEIKWQGNKFLWHDLLEICNAGGRDVTGAVVTIQDGLGQSIVPGAAAEFDTIDLPAAIEDKHSCISIPVDWDFTSVMTSGQGIGLMNIEVGVDLANEIPEDIEDNNSVTASRLLNVNPILGTVGTEFLPGQFIRGISMNNEVFVEKVDWNGDLPDGAGTGSAKRQLLFSAGTASETRDVTGSFMEVWEFDIGNDLAHGSNEILVQAVTRPEFTDEWKQTTYVNGLPAWLGHAVLQGKEEGDFGERMGLYTQKFGFPGFVTEGFFNVPASEIKVAKGEIGPKIGAYEIGFEYRSNGDGKLSGKATWIAKIAGNDVITSSVTLAGTAGPLNGNIALKKLEATWELNGERASPRIRLAPPFSMFEVYGIVQGGVSVTAAVEQTPAGEIDWKSVQLGLSGGVIGMIGAGQQGVLSISGGIGAKLSPTFNLSGNPCILDDLTANMILRAEATALGYSVEYQANIPDPPLHLAGCQGQAGGESQGGPAGSGATGEGPEIKLTPNTGGDWFGTLAANGLPDIRYAESSPALAHHADGSKTLVWVDEDPAKPAHQRLEILSSRYVDGLWHDPIRVTDDALMEYHPTISALPNGNALAVWTHNSAGLTSETASPYDRLGSFDLRYAVFDTTTGLWAPPKSISTGGGLDFLPNLTASDSGATLAYLNNAAGETSLFPEDGKTISNDILFQTYEPLTDSWTSARTVAEDVNTSHAPQVTLRDYGGGVDGFAVWNENINALSGGNKQRVALARGHIFEPPIILADEPVSGVTTTEPDPLGGQLLAWVQPEVQRGGDENDIVDQLWTARLLDGELSTPTLLHESNAIGEPVLHVDADGRAHVTWLETSNKAIDVAAMSRDDAGVWGSARKVSESDTALWWLLPYVEDEEIKVLHLSREIDILPQGGGGDGSAAEGEVADTIGGLLQLSNPTFGLAVAPLGTDLVVSEMWFADAAGNIVESPDLGSEIQVVAIVKNIGDFGSGENSASIQFSGQDLGSASVPSLAPGESVRVSFAATLPDSTASSYTVTTTVDSDSEVIERDEDNNTLSKSALRPDLAIDYVQTELANGTVIVTARVTNIGLAGTESPTPVVLRLDDFHSGVDLPPSAGTVSVPPLASGEQFSIRLEIEDALEELGGERSAYLIIDPATFISGAADPAPHGDGETLNNFAAVTLRPQQLSWQNTSEPLDVNADGSIAPSDVLALVNDLNRLGSRELPFFASPPPFLDVTGDGFVSPIDALQIVNYLNSQGGAEGEAELDGPQSAGITVDPDVNDTALAQLAFDISADDDDKEDSELWFHSLKQEVDLLP